MSDPLDSFSRATRAWFRETLGEPTPPQAQGWPAIQRHEHTLILAPTGSGKTLTAFLWGIDELIGELSGSPAPEGVRLVYVSPLKALNNDIERNLRAPLDGIRGAAVRLGMHPPAVRVAVRTGDTPAAARTQMLKHPPHVLITTPESLYLMLTSPRARAMFGTVRAVIVDEIHTLCGNKRGVHLALTLERLSRLVDAPVQRIGLSATIQPLEEAARFLGGSSRPVTIVNAHYAKPIDLQVVTAVDDFDALPGDTIWPAVIPQVLGDIYRHHTTLIFANNRRLAERTADRLNAQLGAEQKEEIEPGSTEALAPGGIARDRGIFAIGAEGPIRAHHGSMSKEARRQMEEELKAGRLPALVGTSSLELGIDIGSVDLVVQLQSPKSVAQGLQRIGRSGHLVGQTSHGRIYATFREDLVEAAAIARGMLDRDVEPTRTPQNALDVLAQQIVAMVAMEDWGVEALFELVSQAHPYRDLTMVSFRSVLDMLAGKYYLDAPNVRATASLRPKIAWDRVHDRLTALPGSRMLAMSNVGTIPETGAYGAYLNDGKTKIGELDEEFVFETRVGDAFLLGSKVWRVTEIADDRILVADAAGATPRMPFWHGDYPYRPYELGVRIGRFRRALTDRLETRAPDADVLAWLKRDYVLDDNSARNLLDHVRRQLEAVGAMSSDTTIVVETFENAVGDPHMVVHSPFGGRVNGAWAIALAGAIREKTGVAPEMHANDDGVIFRFPAAHRALPVGIVQAMSAAEARERILAELPDSAAFGAQFRMNAARALLLTRAGKGKRTPFWLQRLRARDLLALVRKLEGFPIVLETYRDCLRDVFDVVHLEELLNRVRDGEVRVIPIETAVPSPVAAGLLFNFTAQYLYEWDAPKAERQLQALALPRAALADLLKGSALAELIRPEAVTEVRARAQHAAAEFRARTVEELALTLRELGDLTSDEIASRCAGDGAAWITELAKAGRAVMLGVGGEKRWVPAELADDYRALGEATADEACERVLRRFMRHAGPVDRAAILARYGFGEAWLDEALERLVRQGDLVRGHITSAEVDEYCDIHGFEQIHQRTLTLLRKAVQPVSLFAYADFLSRWQHVHPAARVTGQDSLRRVIEQLRGAALPGPVWEREVLPARVQGYTDELDELADELVWTGSGHDLKRGRVRLFFRGEGALFIGPPVIEGMSAPARSVYDFLMAEGASFASDLSAGLGLRGSDVTQALAELVMAGLVTHDAFDALRQLLAADGLAAPERAAVSALEADLAARMSQRGLRTTTPGRYRDARRKVAQRLRAEDSLRRALPGGRWSLVHRAGVLGPALSDETRADKVARVLLGRYGVVARECLTREEIPLDWSQLYPSLERMEMRGEVRRGYFVAGLSGAQFALPDAVEQLRAAPAGEPEISVLNATDPANIFGGDVAGVVRFSRLPSTHIALERGQPVAIIENSGERITIVGELPAGTAERALAAYLARPGAPRHVAVSQWNGAAVLGGPGQPILKALGFDRVPGGMERRG